MATVDREQMQTEALSRAIGGQSLSNWPAIIAGFAAKGIPEHEVRPRENVFTYHAWRALGRQVRRGEHGVKVLTFVSVKGKEDGIATNDVDGTDSPRRRGYRRPWSATVFHISQTDPIGNQLPDRSVRFPAEDYACSDMGYEDRCAEHCGR